MNTQWTQLFHTIGYLFFRRVNSTFLRSSCEHLSTRGGIGLRNCSSARVIRTSSLRFNTHIIYVKCTYIINAEHFDESVCMSNAYVCMLVGVCILTKILCRQLRLLRPSLLLKLYFQAKTSIKDHQSVSLKRLVILVCSFDDSLRSWGRPPASRKLIPFGIPEI